MSILLAYPPTTKGKVMILWIYLLSAIFATVISFKAYAKYAIEDDYEADEEVVITIGVLSFLTGMLWPIALIGFTVHSLADNYAKSLNARKNEQR